MKYINFLLILSSLLFFSCSRQFKEINPQSNENNIKVKLEIEVEKSKAGTRTPFTLRLINTGERDLGRCSLKFDNKYEHQLEGLINKDEDWEGYLKHSMLKVGESVTIEFSPDCDNYKYFGITDNNFNLPGTIELNNLDGNIVWKIEQ